MDVKVFEGDIAQVESDALVTAVNSEGAWYGGIDGVIQRAAGSWFHLQAKDVMTGDPSFSSLHKQGKTILARGSSERNRGRFRNVVFVIDDLEGPLSQVVQNGLKTASDAGFTSVSLPTIRMGVMLGAVEKSVEEAVGQMREGVVAFMRDNPNTKLSSITFVVYDDPATADLLREELLTIA